MSHNADNTLKAVSNELALKDQRRRSIRRQSTPLETINEKSIARKVNNTCVAVKVVRNRSPSKNPNSSRSRSSSISSDNSCTRMRTRSLSSERESTTGPKTSQYQTDGTSRRQRSTRSFHESRGLNSLDQSQRRPSTSGDESHSALRNVKTKRVCSTCNHPTTESIMQKSGKIINDKEKVSSSKDKSAVSTTHFSSRERAKCAKDTVQKPSSHRPAERDTKQPSSGKESRDTKRREDAPVQNSFRKFTSALGLGKSYPEKKVPTTSQSTESRSVARDKSHENNSRGHSSQVSASQSHERRKTTRNSSRDKKKLSEQSPSDPMTYVFETNLKSTCNIEKQENERCHETTENVENVKATVEDALPDLPETKKLIPPKKPPRKKNKQLAQNNVQETENPMGVSARFSLSDPLPPLPAFETNTYSQQTTLRTCSLPRKAKKLQTKSPLIGKRRPALKYTQSTTSSFAFMPSHYLPAKRNSSVSHIYDNYLLYAQPLIENRSFKKYSNRLRPSVAGLLKPARMRLMRRSVITHRPFSICTCS